MKTILRLIAIMLLFTLCACGEKNTPVRQSPAESKEPLDIEKATATSFFCTVKDLHTYAPWKALDGDPLTAWNEGARGPGLNEALSVTFNKPVEVDRIEIMPGFYDRRWYAQNHRMRKIGVKASGAGFQRDFELTDGMDVKVIKFEKPVKSNEFQFTIKDVYRGAREDEACISEIRFFSKDTPLQLTNGYIRGAQEEERRYNAAFADFRREYPKTDPATPAGKILYDIGIMNDTNSWEYFFENGDYLRIGSGDENNNGFSRAAGTWKMSSGNGSVKIEITKRCGMIGEGDPVYLHACGQWYKDYDYVEEDIRKTATLDWLGYFSRAMSDFAIGEENNGYSIGSQIDFLDVPSLAASGHSPADWRKEADLFRRRAVKEYEKMKKVVDSMNEGSVE